LSSEEEIREVYEDEIMWKSLSVYRRNGLIPFVSDGDVKIHYLWEGIIDEADLEFLGLLEER